MASRVARNWMPSTLRTPSPVSSPSSFPLDDDDDDDYDNDPSSKAQDSPPLDEKLGQTPS